ncbi:MAG: hypothetical protein ACHQEA_07090 [Gaiellales bacterium]
MVAVLAPQAAAFVYLAIALVSLFRARRMPPSADASRHRRPTTIA